MRAYCVICTDLFDGVCPIVSTPCGHTFHHRCLELWFNQSKTCPKCRKQANAKNLLKLFFSIQSNDERIGDNSSLENEIENLKAKLEEKNIDLQKIAEEKETLRLYVSSAESEVKRLQQTNYKYESEIATLQLRVKSLTKLETRVQKLEDRNSALESDLEHLNHVQLIVSGSQKDIDDIVKNAGVGPEASKQLATYCSLLKRELTQVTEAKHFIKSELMFLKKELGLKNLEIKQAREEISSLKDQLRIRDNISFSKSDIFSNDCNSLSGTSSKQATEDIDLEMTPILGPFNRSKTKLNVVIGRSVSSASGGLACKVESLAVGCSKTDENSKICVGYNGFGGHAKVINREKGLSKIKLHKKSRLC